MGARSGMRKTDPRILEALEPGQLVSTKAPFGRRQLGTRTRILMWVLRFYVLLMLIVVGVRITQAINGG